MAELLDEVAKGVVTTEAPRSSLSAGQIEQPYREMGGALKELGAAAGDLAVPLAERQAASDLSRQKVLLAPDGTVSVTNPAKSLLFGDAGNRYAAAVARGTSSQIVEAGKQQLQQFHVDNPLDGEKFRTASDAYIQNVNDSALGQTVAGQAAVRGLREVQAQRQDAITAATATNTIENTKASILAGIDDQKDILSALAASPDGPGSDKWKIAAAEYKKQQQALTSNPLFRRPQELVDKEEREFFGTLSGEHLVATVDDTVNRQNKAAAQEQLKGLLQNENIPRPERLRLYNEGMRHLEFLTNEQTADQKAVKQSLDFMREGMVKGASPSADAVTALRLQARKAGGGLEADLDNLLNGRRAAELDKTLPAAQRGAAFRAGGEASFAPGGFENALARTFREEGGYNPSDANKTPVNFGINQGAHPEVDVSKLTREQAAGIYKRDYWDEIDGDILAKDNPALAHVAFDAAVIAGPNRAKEWISKSGGDPSKFMDLREKYLAGLISSDPDKYGKYADVWAQRNANLRSDIAAPGAGLSAPGVTPSVSGSLAGNAGATAEYLRAMAEDPKVRSDQFGALNDGINRVLKFGNLPQRDDVTAMLQVAATPEQRLKATETLGEYQAQFTMRGGSGTNMGPAMSVPPVPMTAPQRQAFIQQEWQRARDEPDRLQKVLHSAAAKYSEEQEKRAIEAPLQDGHQRWPSAIPQVAPIDPQQPAQLGQNLAQRGVVAEHIGRLNNSEPPAMVEKDDVPGLKAVLSGPGGAQALASIAANVRPQDLQRLTDEPAFVGSLTAMSRSTDKATLAQAYGLMDRLDRDNSMQFEARFGREARGDLRIWQEWLQFKSVDEIAKYMQDYRDSSQAPAREQAGKVADEALKKVSATQVMAKFNTGIPFTPIGTTASAQGDPDKTAASEAMRYDYATLYREFYAKMGDAGKADQLATEALQHKWSASQVNSGRVMAYAPEKVYVNRDGSPQTVNGSFTWMQRQLDSEVVDQVMANPDLRPGLGAIGPFDQHDEARREVARNIPRSLIADDRTQVDISNGRPPSYVVALQDINGRFTVIPGDDGKPKRFAFDYATANAPVAAQAEAERREYGTPAYRQYLEYRQGPGQ